MIRQYNQLIIRFPKYVIQFIFHIFPAAGGCRFIYCHVNNYHITFNGCNRQPLSGNIPGFPLVLNYGQVIFKTVNYYHNYLLWVTVSAGRISLADGFFAAVNNRPVVWLGQRLAIGQMKYTAVFIAYIASRT